MRRAFTTWCAISAGASGFPAPRRSWGAWARGIRTISEPTRGPRVPIWATQHGDLRAGCFPAAGARGAGNATRGLAGRLFTGGADEVSAQHKALGAVYQMMRQQASLMAYVDAFRLLGYLSLACIPVVLLFRRPKRGAHAEPGVHAGE